MTQTIVLQQNLTPAKCVPLCKPRKVFPNWPASSSCTVKFIWNPVIIFLEVISINLFLIFFCFVYQEVHGEIYEVDSNVLSKLDELEEHPTWYKRTKCEIITTANVPGIQAEDVVSCFAYFLTDFTEKFLSHEFLSDYTQDCHKAYSKSIDKRRPLDLKVQSQDK